MSNISRKRIVYVILIGLMIFATLPMEGAFAYTEIKKPQLIAHAGGQIYGFKYTNSLEAIEDSYNNGHRYIELDFEWTLDNEIVLIHDWDNMVKRLFMIEPQQLSYIGFKESSKFVDLTLLDIYDLNKYLSEKHDLFIVTDVKNRNIEFLEYIQKHFNDMSKKLIPQVYSFEEYEIAKELGYENIILTLYKSGYTDDEIVGFAGDNDIFAITMPLEKGYSSLPQRLKEIGIISYVHTINELDVFESLNDNGVYGIYTDYFIINKWIYGIE